MSVVAGGYVIVSAAGAALITAALSERTASSKAETRTARKVAKAASLALPWLFITGLVVFVLINPFF